MDAIKVKNVVKIYKSKRKTVKALNGVSFHVKKGEFFALLGPNGAGKTTLTKILATVLLPDGGEVTIMGYDVVSQADEVRRIIGWCEGENGGRSLYWRLSGIDNLKLFAALYGLNPRDAEKRIWALLKFLDLDHAAYKLVKSYSLGMKIKLMLARALIHDPEVLLLDEPTLGLDVESAIKIRRFLKTLCKEVGKTIFFTSHNMYEVEALADRIAVINKGKIIFIGTPDELKRRVEKFKIVEVTLLSNDAEEIKSKLMKMPVVRKILSFQRRENTLHFRVLVDNLYEAISDIALALKGYKIERIERALPSLEEAFLRLVFQGEAK